MFYKRQKAKNMLPTSILFLGAGQAARKFFWFPRDRHPETCVGFVKDLAPTTEQVIAGETQCIAQDVERSTPRREFTSSEHPFTHVLVGLSAKPIRRAMEG